jgi:hypothetical protein
MRRLRPNETVETVLDIDFEALRAQGKTALLFDWDNTLTKRRSCVLPQPSAALLSRLTDSGFRIGILTNRRARRTADGVSFPMIYHAGKPRGRSYRSLLTQLAASEHEAVMIGDRRLTDVLGGNRVGLYTILVRRPPRNGD